MGIHIGSSQNKYWLAQLMNGKTHHMIPAMNYSDAAKDFEETLLLLSYKGKRLLLISIIQVHSIFGRGCGAVGRSVASDTRDPRFDINN